MKSVFTFLHIPKCGGSSIRYSVKSFNQIKFKNDVNRTIYLYNKTIVSGKDINLGSSQYEEIFEAFNSNKINSIIGHFNIRDLEASFGNKLSLFNLNLFSTTRNPIERCISTVNYISVRPKHKAYKRLKNITQDNLFQFLMNRCSPSKQLEYLLNQEQIEYFNLSKDKSKLDNLISDIKNKVKIYKIENSHILLKNSLHFDENFTYQIKNKSSNINREKPLLTIDMLSKSEIEELNERFMPDFKLYSFSL